MTIEYAPICWLATPPSKSTANRLDMEGSIIKSMALSLGKSLSWLYNCEDDADIENASTDMNQWNGIGVSDGKVIRIDWYDEGLTGRIPEEIGSLTGLTYLFLGDNNLTGNIPTGIGRLGSLRQLNLTRNMLTGKVPKTFRMLGKLEEMGLYNNDMDVDVPGYLGGEDLRLGLLGTGKNFERGRGREEAGFGGEDGVGRSDEEEGHHGG